MSNGKNAAQLFEDNPPCWMVHCTVRQLDVEFSDIGVVTEYGLTQKLTNPVRVF